MEGFFLIFILFGMDLKLENDFLEVVGRWKERSKVNFNDSLDIGEIDTYDHVIEIESKHGVHLIERTWMKKKEFDTVKKRLQGYWMY